VPAKRIGREQCASCFSASYGPAFQAQGMAVFVQQHRQQVHFAVRRAAGFGDPFVRVADRQEVFVQVGGVADKPTMAGSVLVSSVIVASAPSPFVSPTAAPGRLAKVTAGLV
jgi:hypothetical protein